VSRAQVKLRRDLERLVASSPKMAQTLGDIAKKMADEARNNARGRSRRVADEVTHEVTRDEDGRVVGRVAMNHWSSQFIEFGTADQSPVAPLRRAADSFTNRKW
jgi:hypothetical protein